ncbi:ribokinase [Desulfacinum hydrothermale DSM 13146]|uniref:Ribokinase n=1 Tax=Desulfacinum hydrothermale DSM 13146 TaxID=1121390 RepID=A0A1W1XDI4_9BACT|nr:PfkB family carbohydrate kinase [Desulfacinum hydrothermale]SMC21953.1 ribokinase [Desulfacinum hydrothermale DSM 13146]
MVGTSGQSEACWDVVGVGQCALDYLGRVDAYPPPDTKCEFQDLTIQGGGPAATALVALARWGWRTALCSVVGDDPFGREIRASLDREGVDGRYVRVRSKARSQFAFIAVEPGSGRRTIFWRRPTGDPLRPEEVPVRAVGAARVLLTDGLFVEAALGAARAARQQSVPVVVDAGTLRDGMLELARLSDHFITSEAFARSLMGGPDPEGACRKLAELGPEVVGVTLGPRGSLFFCRGAFLRQPADSIEAVDTTGCGDVFHGAYVHGLLSGWDLKRRVRFASWAAAQAATRLGGRAGIPSPSQSPDAFRP